MAEVGYILSEEDRQVLSQMIRAWRSGSLRPPAPQRQYIPSQSRYGPLWQVTSVLLGNCTVQRIDSEGDLVAGTQITGVACSALVQKDDLVILVRAGDGKLTAFVGGGRPAYGNATIGSVTLTDTASPTIWQRQPDVVGETMTLTIMTRWTYNSGGGQKLYGFFRNLVLDALGLYSVSAETRVTIDTPGECS
jgi:hypothetical protein